MAFAVHAVYSVRFIDDVLQLVYFCVVLTESKPVIRVTISFLLAIFTIIWAKAELTVIRF